MPEPDIFRVLTKFRRELLANERQASTRMVRYYGQAWTRIKARVGALTAEIVQARAAGTEVKATWLYERGRLQVLQMQVEAEIRNFAQFAEQEIVQQQAAAVRAALDHARQLAMASMGPPPAGVRVGWLDLNPAAVQDLVGYLHDGSPLRALLDELPGQVTQSVSDALVRGIVLGWGPRETARMVRREVGMSMVRALRISRTETLRAYRESTRRAYKANDQIVTGWIWHSALGTRTCAACWAMHGTFHSLDERLDDHPNGKCSMAPATKTWAELGLEGVPETRIRVDPGAKLFRQLDRSEQVEILGKAKYEAFQAGDIELKDLVGRARSRQWGTHRYERSLKDAMEARG